MRITQYPKNPDENSNECKDNFEGRTKGMARANNEKKSIYNYGASYASDTSDSKNEFPPKCYYCGYLEHRNKKEYERHCVTRHPGLLCYPGPADIRKSALTPQGMFWEKLT
jgi:hypothetical protein